MAPEDRRPVTEDGEAASTQEVIRPEEEEVVLLNQVFIS